MPVINDEAPSLGSGNERIPGRCGRAGACTAVSLPAGRIGGNDAAASTDAGTARALLSRIDSLNRWRTCMEVAGTKWRRWLRTDVLLTLVAVVAGISGAMLGGQYLRLRAADAE